MLGIFISPSLCNSFLQFLDDSNCLDCSTSPMLCRSRCSPTSCSPLLASVSEPLPLTLTTTTRVILESSSTSQSQSQSQDSINDNVTSTLDMQMMPMSSTPTRISAAMIGGIVGGVSVALILIVALVSCLISNRHRDIKAATEEEVAPSPPIQPTNANYGPFEFEESDYIVGNLSV